MTNFTPEIVVSDKMTTKSFATKMNLAKMFLIAATLWALPQLVSAQKYYYNGKGTPDSITSWTDSLGAMPTSFSASPKASFIFGAASGKSTVHISKSVSIIGSVIDSINLIIDSGAVLTISGGKLTIRPITDSIIVSGGANLVYDTRTAATLTGALHIANGGWLTLTRNIATVPAAKFDSTSNLAIGNGTDSITVLPKLVAKAIYGNITINAPAVNSSLSARFIPNTAGTYNIVGDFNVLAGRVSNSNSGTKVVSKTLAIGGNLNIKGGTYIVCDSTSANDKVKVAGGINITSGALFTTNNFVDTLLGRGTISVQGDLIHSGGLLGTANTSKIGGKILFSCVDTAGQAFSTTGFYNDKVAPLRLEVNGGNEVEVTSDVTVNDTLVLTLGYFTVTAGNTLTLNKGSKGQSDSSYIITDAAVDSATMGKATFNDIPKGKLFVMPIGNDSTYQPISVLTADDSASFTAYTYNGVTKNATTLGGAITDSLALNNLVNSTWHIQRIDAGKNPVTTIFKWSSVMAGSTFTHQPDSSISVFQNDGSGVLKPLVTASYSPSDSAVVTLTSFGNFMIGFNPTALPVKFIGVAATIHGNAVVVDWKIASEMNIVSYTIEKSSNGKSFIAIGTAKANHLINYTFDDNLLYQGTTYYRIKAVDKSGNTTYSPVVTVIAANLTGSFRLFPNPVLNGTLNVELTNQSIGIYQVSLLNAAGQVLTAKQINHSGGSSITAFDVANLNVKGLCYVRITSNIGQSITKTVLIK